MTKAPRVFILTHNPDFSVAIDKKPGLIERTSAGKTVADDWSTGNQKGIRAGDIGFLLRQGERRGIIASAVFEKARPLTRKRVLAGGVSSNGNFDEVVYQDWHWNDREESVRLRRIANYVDLQWTRVLHSEDRLQVEELFRRFKSVHWNMMYGSGVEIKGSDAQRLVRVWAEHLELVDSGGFLSEGNETEEGYKEGRRVSVSISRYERKPENRKACIDHHGTSCGACGFDFEKNYGARGRGFIHVHHKNPLALSGGAKQVDPIKDMIPLCPNCHAMVHRYSPLLTIPALKKVLKKGEGA